VWVSQWVKEARQTAETNDKTQKAWTGERRSVCCGAAAQNIDNV
jgi:hypothetical protein